MIYGSIAIKGDAGPVWIKAEAHQKPGTVDIYFGDVKNGGDFSVTLDAKGFLALVELGRKYLAAGEGFAQGAAGAKVDVLPEFSVNMEAVNVTVEPKLDGTLSDGIDGYFKIQSKRGHVTLVPNPAQVKALRDCCQNFLDARAALEKAKQPIKAEAVPASA